MSMRSRLAFAALTLVVAGLFAALGCWQAGRAEQKARMQAEREAAGGTAPAALADVLGQALPKLPIRVVGEVMLRPAPLLLLDNQQRDGRVGVRAYALADAADGRVLLVELGWLPLAPDRTLPQATVPAGRHRIDGMLVPWPGQGLRLAENAWGTAAASVLLAFLERQDVEQHLAISLWDGVLRPDPSDPIGYARDQGRLPDPMPPERHRGYAVQWWGLSLTVIITYLILSLRRKSR